MPDQFFTLFNVLFCSSVAASGCAILWLIFRPRSPEKNFHVFYRISDESGRAMPLYETGPGPGTRAWLDLPGTHGDWKQVTVTGYLSYGDAVKAARYLNQTHTKDVVQVYDLHETPTDALMARRFHDAHMPIPTA